MTRTQVQFGAHQYQRLKALASRRGVSMAQLVREAVEAILERDQARDRWEDLASVAGKYGDGGEEAVGREHDRHLDEGYEDWRGSS